MRIKYLGHSCFLLTNTSGVKILTDPFNETVGYKVPSEEANIVTTSHEHYDHSYIQAVKGEFIHLNQPGHFAEYGIEILGVPTFHDDTQGSQRGKNIIFKFIMDGLNICHCGDLGHVLTAEQLRNLGQVDVLMLPVGGYYTVDSQVAAQISQLLRAVVIIPMHFKTSLTHYPITDVQPFLDEMGGGQRLGKQEIEITPENLRGFKGVVVLDYE